LTLSRPPDPRECLINGGSDDQGDASHAGDRDGLVDGALDARAGAVFGAPLLAGLLGAGLVKGFIAAHGAGGIRGWRDNERLPVFERVHDSAAQFG
jgi:hypothetical protein